MLRVIPFAFAMLIIVGAVPVQPVQPVQPGHSSTPPPPSTAPTVVQAPSTAFNGSGSQCSWTVPAIRTGDTVVGYMHSVNLADTTPSYPTSVTDNVGNTYNLWAPVEWIPWHEDVGIWYLQNARGNPTTFTFSGFPLTPYCNTGFVEYSGVTSLSVLGSALVYGTYASMTISPTAPSLIWAFAADWDGGLSSLQNSGYSVLIDNYDGPLDDIVVWGSNGLVPAGPLTLTWYSPYGATNANCMFQGQVIAPSCPMVGMAVAVSP